MIRAQLATDDDNAAVTARVKAEWSLPDFFSRSSTSRATIKRSVAKSGDATKSSISGGAWNSGSLAS
jgi:hypothetical protein